MQTKWLRIIMWIWSALTVVFFVLFALSDYIGVGKVFFLFCGVANLILLILTAANRQRLQQLIRDTVDTCNEYHRESSQANIRMSYRGAKPLGMIAVGAAGVFGAYLILNAIFDVPAYMDLIREDGLVEYASACFWGLTALVLTWDLFARRGREGAGKLYLAAHVLLILFCIVCGGEEISWGQRLFDLQTPEMLKVVNVQDELTLHNIGSISVFSNVFFLLTLLFFLVVPYLMRRYEPLRFTIWHLDLPLPGPQVVVTYLTILVIWVVIGVRFGTLGFHPFSFYAAEYYTQADDEIFELLVAYCFFVFGVMHATRKIQMDAV